MVMLFTTGDVQNPTTITTMTMQGSSELDTLMAQIVELRNKMPEGGDSNTFTDTTMHPNDLWV